MAMRLCLKRLWLFIILSFPLVNNLWADPTPAEADSVSYALYCTYEYQELIQYGETCLKQKIDFYLLRLRLGIAYYRLANYERAWPHLEVAQKQEPGQPITISYLFWSYTRTHQNDKANALFEKYHQLMDGELPGIQRLWVLEAEAGALFTNNEKNYGEVSLQQPEDTYQAADIFTSMQYLRLYGEHRVKKNVRIFAGLNVFRVSSLNNSWTKPLPIPPFPAPPADSLRVAHTDYSYQVNLGLSKLWRNGLRTSLAGAWCHERFTYQYVGLDESLDSKNYLLLNAGVSKKWGRFEPIIMAGVFDMNSQNQTQWQADLGVTCFPLKKNNLWFFTSLGGVYTQNMSEPSLVFNQKVGYEFLDGKSIQLSYLGGMLDNYMSNLGFVTLNTFDPINWQGSAQFSFPIKKLILTPGYQLQNRGSSSITHMRSVNFDQLFYLNSESYSYFSHLFYITLKFNP